MVIQDRCLPYLSSGQTSSLITLSDLVSIGGWLPQVNQAFSAKFPNFLLDYISVPHSSDFAFGSGGVTISAWFYSFNASIQQTIIETFLPSDGIHVNQAGFQLNLGGQETIGATAFSQVIKQKMFLYFGQDLDNSWEWGDTATTILTNHWYHVGVTYMSGTLKYYINGSLSSTLAMNNLSMGDSGSTLSIGCSPDNGSFGDNYPWNGYLSNISLWRTALSATNIGLLYANGNPPDIVNASSFSGILSNLVAWWKLGGPGDTVTSWADSSGNGHNGTTHGGGLFIVSAFPP